MPYIIKFYSINVFKLCFKFFILLRDQCNILVIKRIDKYSTKILAFIYFWLLNHIYPDDSGVMQLILVHLIPICVVPSHPVGLRAVPFKLVLFCVFPSHTVPFDILVANVAEPHRNWKLVKQEATNIVIKLGFWLVVQRFKDTHWLSLINLYISLVLQIIVLNEQSV